MPGVETSAILGRMSDQVGVIGAGAWGTTLAIMLADAQRPVSLWTHSAEAAEQLAHGRENARYLPGVTFPPNLRVATDDAHLAEPYRFYLAAVPSAHLAVDAPAPASAPDRWRARPVGGEGHRGGHPRPDERGDHRGAPGRRVAVLSGPNLAREIAAGKPAGTVVASEDAELAAELASVIGSDRFRVYTNPDVIGVELRGRAEERRGARRRHGRRARLR